MDNNKWNRIWEEYIKRNCKIIFPVILVAAVAITVVIALNAGKSKEEIDAASESEQSSSTEQIDYTNQQIPLTANEDEAISAIIATYYQALGSGDTETIKNVYDTISESDLLYYTEQAKYLQKYSNIEIFTKPGLTEGNTVAYVYYRVSFVNREEEFPGYETFYLCKRDDGKLFIKNEDNFTEEEKDYIKTVTDQEDVVEFNNKVNVEYNDLMVEHPDLLEYLGVMGEEVNSAVGVILAEKNASEESAGEIDESESGETTTEQPEATEQPESSGVAEPLYGKANTTVNVRSSDSEKADKLGKLTSGTKVQIQENRVNGWTKILFEGKDGYVKSEFLTMEESTAGVNVIGSVVANANINVRTEANETADRLGILAGGESLELISNENGWCKVKYNGRIGYVKSEYVSVQ